MFVTHRDHGYTESRLMVAKFLAVVCVVAGFLCNPLAFVAAVPAEIFVVSVSVLLTVREIVLRIVGDKIPQSESIMRGDEVDALFGFSISVSIDIGACKEPLRGASISSVSFYKRTNVISESSVPFSIDLQRNAPLDRGQRHPMLRQSVSFRLDRVCFDIPEDQWIALRFTMDVSGQYRSEVKAKSIDMHLLNPESKAVQDEASNNGVIRIERVTAAAIVGIAKAAVRSFLFATR